MPCGETTTSVSFTERAGARARLAAFAFLPFFFLRLSVNQPGCPLSSAAVGPLALCAQGSVQENVVCKGRARGARWLRRYQWRQRGRGGVCKEERSERRWFDDGWLAEQMEWNGMGCARWRGEQSAPCMHAGLRGEGESEEEERRVGTVRERENGERRKEREKERKRRAAEKKQELCWAKGNKKSNERNERNEGRKGRRRRGVCVACVVCMRCGLLALLLACFTSFHLSARHPPRSWTKKHRINHKVRIVDNDITGGARQRRLAAATGLAPQSRKTIPTHHHHSSLPLLHPPVSRHGPVCKALHLRHRLRGHHPVCLFLLAHRKLLRNFCIISFLFFFLRLVMWICSPSEWVPLVSSGNE